MSGPYHLLAWLTSPTMMALVQAIVRSRLFNLVWLSIRIAKFVEVNIGITPRNVRSEAVAPCKCSRLPKT